MAQPGRAHLAYDLAGDPPRLRARISAESLSPEWRDILESAAATVDWKPSKSRCCRSGTRPSGTGDKALPDQVRDAFTTRLADASVIDVPDANHHSILVSRPGAQAVAQAIDIFTRSRLRADCADGRVFR